MYLSFYMYWSMAHIFYEEFFITKVIFNMVAPNNNWRIRLLCMATPNPEKMIPWMIISMAFESLGKWGSKNSLESSRNQLLHQTPTLRNQASVRCWTECRKNDSMNYYFHGFQEPRKRGLKGFHLSWIPSSAKLALNGFLIWNRLWIRT